MEYNNSPEYETAQSRISTLLDQIGEQLQAIATSPEGSSDVDVVIAEQDKSSFIFKQNELISAYRNRDEHDDRDSYIAKLKAELDKTKRDAEAESNRWFREYQTNCHLRSALRHVVCAMSDD